MQLTTRICSLHSVLINLVTKVEQVILCLSLYQQKCSLSIMYLLAWNIFVLQASLWALCHSSSVYCKAAFSRHLGTPHWQAAQWAKLNPEVRAEKGLTQWLWEAEHPCASHTGGSNSETSEDTPDGSVSCTRSLDAPRACVSHLKAGPVRKTAWATLLAVSPNNTIVSL